MDVFIPISSVQAIYGKENNEGMFFPDESTPPPSPEPEDQGPASKGRPSLKVVK
jgi:stringent starvation protein B